MITKHDLNAQLGTRPENRQAQYRALFERDIPPYTSEDIKSATDKMWVLSNDKFKQQVKNMAGRRVPHLPKGGDRELEEF